MSLAQSLMERVVSCYDEKKTNIIKADVITSMARKMSSILCLTKTQNDQMLHFWKTMMVFVFPESEAVTKRVHASFNSCVRQSLRDDQNQIETCQRYFQECSFFSIALDSTLVRNEHLLSCFARFSFDDHIKQVPVFFEVCPDQSGNGIAQFVFNKLLENNVKFAKLVSVCTDGATAMTGRFGGMTTVLKRLIWDHCTRTNTPFQDFHTVWCLAHRINLVTRDLMDMKGINIVKAFSDWFLDNRRQTAYKKFIMQDSTRQRLRSIPQPSDTRWLFYRDVVSAILSQRNTVDELSRVMKDF